MTHHVTYRSRATVGLLSTPCSTPNSVTTISGFLSSSVKLHRRRTIAGKLLAFGFVVKIVTTPCGLGLLPAAQNFLASIWPLIEILRSLVRVCVSAGPDTCPHPHRSAANHCQIISIFQIIQSHI